MKRHEKKLAAVASLVVILIGAAYLIYVFGPGESERVSLVTSAESVADESTEPAPISSADELADAETPGRRATVEIPRVANELAVEVQAKSLAEIKGCFVLPSGLPAIGVEIALTGWTGNSGDLRKLDKPTDFENSSATTDHEGRFTILFDPPQTYQFTLDAKVEACAKESWRWDHIETGAVIDVGEVVLKHSGTIVGSLVDGAGKPLHESWQIYADSEPSSGVDGKDSTRVSTPLDSTTGRFRIEGLPPGPTQLQAYSPIANWIDGPVVEVIAGEQVETEIVYAGPENSRRIVVVPFIRPYNTLKVAADDILLVRSGMEPRKSKRMSRAAQSFVFDDLASGTYTVECKDERFQPWSESLVEVGSRVKARLKGNVAIRLEVLDGTTGELVVGYALDVRLEGVNSRPNVFRIHDGEEKLPPGGLFDGFLPLPQTLLIDVPGYAICEVPLLDLAPFETRTVCAKVHTSASLAGRVLQADGQIPVPHARVWLLPLGGEPLEEWGQPQDEWTEDQTFQREVRADGAGRFEMNDLPTGQFSVQAAANAWLSGRIEEVALRAGENHSDLVVLLPPSAALRGRLLVPEGAQLDDLRLAINPPGKRVREDIFSPRSEGITLELSSSGNFESGPLPPGQHTLTLVGPDVFLPMSHHAGVPVLEFAALTLKAGEVVEREFDVRNRWPGSIEVDVRLNGHPAEGFVVEVVQTGATNNGRSGGVTGAAGSVAVNHLFPGDYHVLARSKENKLRVPLPGTITVHPAQATSCTIEMTVVRGEVLVLDEKSERPLANRQFLISALDSDERQQVKSGHLPLLSGVEKSRIPVHQL